MSTKKNPIYVGRGSHLEPANRFESLHYEDDKEHHQVAAEGSEWELEQVTSERARVPTVYLDDDTKSIVSENQSPDIGFRYSVNPYRGCQHGCAYCYARPTHEYLGFNAGIDFETKILVKRRAPDLLRRWLARSSWQCEPIMFSGVVDCYQPVERELELTRQCLQVAWEARQPISIVTKNALVCRDLDLLEQMARQRLAQVAISITSNEQSLIRALEPRTSSPAARWRTVETLAAAGVPVRVMIAPVIPGLNDHEIASLLQHSAASGARSASYVLLRLPHTVRPVFLEWLDREMPERAGLVQSRLKAMRGGDLYHSEFGSRMRGEGILAEQIHQQFQLFARNFGLTQEEVVLDCSQFRTPRDSGGQMRLF